MADSIATAPARRIVSLSPPAFLFPGSIEVDVCTYVWLHTHPNRVASDYGAMNETMLFRRKLAGD